MEIQKSLKSVFAGSIGLVTLFALVGQFILGAFISKLGTTDYVIQFFSYFTILSNVSVLLCCFFTVFSAKSRMGLFFTTSQTITAVTLYILIVALIYNGLLRFLLHPSGLLSVIDEILHVVTPLSFFIFWWLFCNKKALFWKQIFYWLIFPLGYLLYTLWHGSVSGFYPYPFMNVSALGMGRVIWNSLGMTLVFVLIAVLLIGLGKWQNKWCTHCIEK
ncbi:Pr6Pr family membrane protein [uncultured Sphingobacterium sp.]|uniref:Pr6Pr family membrane protein n=1 Tax=uncultured Sphingobacterium sp. TaxID=182688 RepID=UPI0025E6CCF0|nr:Pr6Pr family membrane protein [uncultured Sphingobacterium sp.]